MGIIKAAKLVHEYIRRDEDGKVEEIRRAVDGVDLDVQRGEFIAILGHNGSGKSTLAKHINAILAPTEGTMWVGGMDTKEEKDIWNIRQTAGMVFQNPDNQIVSSVVEDDVAFGPENLGIDPAEIRKRVDDALHGVEMYEFRKKAPHMLSGGQKQRIAIAGAVAMEPECIVFDEPTAMLDPRGRHEVLSIVKKLNSKGITTLLITHFMEEAAQADRIVVMDNGYVRMTGTPEEIFRRAGELRELSLDVPPAVDLAMKLRERGIDVPEDILTEEDMVKYLCQ